MTKSEAYLDIVWRQFTKNRFALWSLRALGPVCLMAIFAPVIASNQPLVFWDGTDRVFPWFRALFNPETAVDFVFNMALVAFFPWLATSLGLGVWWRRREVPMRWRIGCVALLYAAMIVLLTTVFVVPRFRPENTYYSRTFAEEEFKAAKARPKAAKDEKNAAPKHGLYVLVPFGPTQQDLGAVFQPPLFRKPQAKWEGVHDGFPHLLGTDDSGRDVLVRMIYGTRISLTVGFVAVSLYLTIGVFVGAVAGYFGGLADMAISRVIEIILLFPSFFLILTLVGLIGPSIYIIMLVIGITGWPMIARLIRGEVLKQREIDYVAAARALGSSPLRIIFRHILPNAVSPALVAVPFGISDAIITEATLSLLGFGVAPPAPSWGSLLQLGHGNYAYWWLVVVPSLAIFCTVTIFNLVGNGLRDAMDPRLRR